MTQRTNKIHITGTVDKLPVDVELEFATLDKDALITQIRNSAAVLGVLGVADIHGNVFNLNFALIKMCNLKIIEVFNVPPSN